MKFTALVVMSVLLAAANTSAQRAVEGNVIGLLEVPELLPANPCEAVALTAVPLYSAPAATARMGELRVVRGPLNVIGDASSCDDGPDVRVVIGGTSVEVDTQEHGYEEESLVVTATAPGWYQIRTGTQPGLAWMRATGRSVYRPLANLLKDGLTYLRSDWDRRLYTSPYGSFRVVPRLAAPDQHFEPMVKVNEVALAGGVYWARVTFIENLCTPEEPSGQGRGWVKVHGPKPSGRPMLWFHSRGC